jgi:anti-anti-sigma regulatory factor
VFHLGSRNHRSADVEGATPAPDARPRPFRLSQIESWPECLEIIVEGSVDSSSATDEFEARLQRVVETDHDYVLIDLDRCQFIDVVAVKQLVVTQELLFCRGQELLLFGARGQVRRILEQIEAFDPRVLLDASNEPPA